MATYIAFLRAVNVGGRFIKMADLRAGLSRMGFDDVDSHIQSGNLRFTSSLRSAAKVELAAEVALRELCGFSVSTIVRTPAELGELSAYGLGLVAPLTASPEADVQRYVIFLKKNSDADIGAMVNGWAIAGERAHLHGREVYVWLTHAAHQAKLTNARIERRGVVATTRAWKVVSALGEKWGA